MHTKAPNGTVRSGFWTEPKEPKEPTETEPNRSVRPETYLVIVERRILAH